MFDSADNPQQQNEVWNLIWGLNVPNKVRNFMWQVCKEAIPAKHNLMRRKILNEDRCEHCGVEAEQLLMHFGIPPHWTKYGIVLHDFKIEANLVHQASRT